ncbi:InlB B-repeat-containing protein, partial [Methanocorpusculum sp. MG]
MSLCNYGANRPHDSLAELWRSGVVLLAALLLVCTLMAGAVSAAGLSYSQTDGVLYEITAPGEYTLSADITENGSNETLILINADGVTLNGNDKTITGSDSTKYGIRVASGKENFQIKNFQNITNVHIAGIWAGSNKSTAWDIGSSTISGVTIGDVTAPGFTPKDTTNPNPVTNLTYGVTVYSIGSGTLTVSDVHIKGKIHGDGSAGIATHVTNGDLTLQRIYIDSTANIISEWGGGNKDQNGRTYYNAHGILAWAFGTGKVTVSDSLVTGTIKAVKGNSFGIDEQTQSGATGQGLIENCIISATLSGNWAYGIAVAVIEDGTTIVQNSVVNATLQGSAMSEAIGIFDNVNKVVATNVVSRTATIQNNILNATYSLGNTKTAVRFYSGNTLSGLTINLKENTLSVDSQPAYFFHGSATNMDSVTLNVEDNTLPVSQAVFYDNDASKPFYTGIVAGNKVTGTPTPTYLATDNTKARFSKITWGLTPSENVPGVAWTGDTANGYTLAISESGSYKLMKDVNLKSMTVSADNVVIDGNKDAGVTITAKSGDSPVIKSTGTGVTLQNLKVVGTGDFAQGKFIELTGTSTTLKDSVIDFSKAKTTASSSFHTVYLSGSSSKILDSTIKAGASETSSSQCIVVQGKSGTSLSSIEITGNTLVPNTATVYKSDDTKVSSGSIGVRIAAHVTDVTIKDNTITCEVDADKTSMNNGIAIDSVNQAVTVTANNNKFTLSGNAAKLESSKKGQVGGFGNVFYVNPDKGISTNAITINANGNTVNGGTYFLYADSDNGAVTSEVKLEGTISANSFGAISGKAYQVTPVEVSGFSVTSTITWSDNVEPAVPDVPKVTPTIDTEGNTVVTPSTPEDTTFSEETHTATIGNADTSPAVIQISGDGVKHDSTSGAITVPETAEIKAVYKEAPVDAPATVGTTTYQLNIILTEVDTENLPTISPAFDAAKANLVPSGYTVASMITATTNVAEINQKIGTGGIQLTFTVPAAWVNAIGKSRLAVFHIKNNKAEPVSMTSIQSEGNYFKITIKADNFSTYALAGYTSSQASSSGNTNNAFRVLFDTQGGSYVSPATGLSYGDKISQPANPVKDGYTFGGWYKDAACTQAWSFSDSIPGDMTLYAKWTS